MEKPAAVVLSYDPPGPQFPISEQCDMPKITVTATFQNVTPDPKMPLQYQWKVTLSFTGVGCVHSKARKIDHPEISQTTSTNKFAIPFTKVRGGDLKISLSVTVGKNALTTQSQNLQVTGTNPSIAALQGVAAKNDAFRKLMRHESNLRQFLSATCPLFSGDDQGGVGICQITSPAPTDDQVWNWKENLKAGWQLYQSKESVASKYPDTVRKSSEFAALVKAYNDQRAAKAKAAAAPSPATTTPAAPSPSPAAAAPMPAAPPSATQVVQAKPLVIDLPDYTAEQLERDTLRGFNGYAGQLHEYRVRVDINGLLVVTEDAAGTKGTAEWQLVTAADRIAHYDKIGLAANRRGDPNYVDNVVAKATF